MKHVPDCIARLSVSNCPLLKTQAVIRKKKKSSHYLFQPGPATQGQRCVLETRGRRIPCGKTLAGLRQEAGATMLKLVRNGDARCKQQSGAHQSNWRICPWFSPNLTAPARAWEYTENLTTPITQERASTFQNYHGNSQQASFTSTSPPDTAQSRNMFKKTPTNPFCTLQCVQSLIRIGLPASSDGITLQPLSSVMQAPQIRT